MLLVLLDYGPPAETEGPTTREDAETSDGPSGTPTYLFISRLPSAHQDAAASLLTPLAAWYMDADAGAPPAVSASQASSRVDSGNVYRQLLARIEQPKELSFLFDGMVGPTDKPNHRVCIRACGSWWTTVQRGEAAEAEAYGLFDLCSLQVRLLNSVHMAQSAYLPGTMVQISFHQVAHLLFIIRSSRVSPSTHQPSVRHENHPTSVEPCLIL